MLGNKIKELRRKHDMTQEKLADFLCVSYQAVSKWETGISNPDLSMIVPLARLFNVTADELLGLDKLEPDQHRADLEAAYQETYKSGNLAKRHEIAETLTHEYPGVMKYLKDFAWTTASRSFECEDNERYAAEQEKAIKMFATVIENTDDVTLKGDAISGIVQYLSYRNRKNEALKYVEIYPESPIPSKDELMLFCLSGDEHTKHLQNMLMNSLWTLTTILSRYTTLEAKQLEELLVNLFITDDNYNDFHFMMCGCVRRQIDFMLEQKRHDEVVTLLKRLLFHSIECDKIVANAPTQKYTAPWFDLIEYNSSRVMLVHTSGKSTTEGFYELLTFEQFDPLRENEDFKSIPIKRVV